jgi:hypothetical protein
MITPFRVISVVGSQGPPAIPGNPSTQPNAAITHYNMGVVLALASYPARSAVFETH